MNARTQQASDQYIDGTTFLRQINYPVLPVFERIGSVNQIFFIRLTNPICSETDKWGE